MDKKKQTPQIQPIPSFFIIGAPKAGTSSIRACLLSNYRLYIPDPVEPNYFCSDLKLPTSPGGDIAWYLDRYYYIDASKYDLIGEKSTWYLYSNVAVDRIMSFNPGAKIIVILRNPIELAQAFHQELIFNRMETIVDFEGAWRLCKTRAGTRGNKLLLYDQVASIGTQCERLLTQVPREQLFITFLDDLRSDPKTLYANLGNFLALPPKDINTFPVVNESKEIKNRYLDYLFTPPKFVADGVERFKQMTGIRRLGIGLLMWNWRLRFNTQKVKRGQLPDSLKMELLEYFEPEVRKLEKITGRDLSHYLK